MKKEALKKKVAILYVGYIKIWKILFMSTEKLYDALVKLYLFRLCST